MTHIEQSKALKPRRPMSTAPPAPLAAVTSKCIHQPYQPLRRCLALQPSPSHRLPSRASLGSSPPPFLYDLRIRHGPAQPSSAVLMPSCPHTLDASGHVRALHAFRPTALRALCVECRAHRLLVKT